MKKFLILPLLFLSSGSLWASDNTELLDREPTSVSTANFEYKTFSSCSEMESTFRTMLKNLSAPMRPIPLMMERATTAIPIADTAGSAKSSVAPNTPHSETNIQVAGVNEADTVKTDGKYLYVYNETNKVISIIDAKKLSKKKNIKIPSNYANTTFYLSKNKLIITATKYGNSSTRWYGWYDTTQKSIIALYDIRTPEKPSLTRVIQVDGVLSDSRLTEEGMLTAIITNTYALPPIYTYDTRVKPENYEYSQKTLIPQILDTRYSRASGYKTESSSITPCAGLSALLPDAKTLETHEITPSLTSIIRLDTSISDGPIATEVLLSEAGQIHLSKDSLYLSSPSYVSGISSSKCPPNARCMMPMIWNPSAQSTLVHRFAFSGASTQYVYSTALPGTALSQYSMDEDNQRQFRIVTTEQGEKQSSRLSILSLTGGLIGSLSGIAPGENFQSSRFIGDRLYLVTFQQIDPLFVVSLTNPAKPTILGELKIPGYSTYLHPYDSSRLIGIGYDTMTNTHGGVQNAGLKVDLYDVSDVQHPKQEQSLILGGAGSSSDVLTNPRAFTWYREKNLLLLPALIMESAGDKQDLYRAKSAFQGVVGISITPSAISEKFRISHIIQPPSLVDDWKKDCRQYTGSDSTPSCQKLLDGSQYCPGSSVYVPPYCYADATVDTYLASQIWSYSGDFISRVLYIGDDLYTVGESRVQRRSLSDPKTLLGEAVFPVKKSPILVPMVEPAVMIR